MMTWQRIQRGGRENLNVAGPSGVVLHGASKLRTLQHTGCVALHLVVCNVGGAVQTWFAVIISRISSEETCRDDRC